MTWAPDYITADDLADYMRIGDAVDDVELALAVTAASRAIDLQCNRQFGKVAAAEERFYTPDYDYCRSAWWIAVDDLQVVTNFALEVDGTAVTDYTLEPRNAAAQGRPWTRLYFGDDAEVEPDGTDVSGVRHGHLGMDRGTVRGQAGHPAAGVTLHGPT
jgi:hypothetical protein